ncbi:hypothetical protein [Pedobacter sp. MW01-1-1]|uniref:hypothetical protein n=1 Tax=Pedobacter sp. MW01-1-1 TaxID=3383027 RepID=UPI003FEE8ECD
MKKRIFRILAASILLLLICCIGYFGYRRYQANKVLVPSSVVSVLKINTFALAKTISISAVKHPKEYDNELEKQIENLGNGLEISGDIFMYALKNASQSALFTTFDIKDSVRFLHFIKTQKVFPLEKEGSNFYQSADSTFAILFNEKTVALAYSAKKEKLEPTLKSLLAKKNLVKLAETAFKDILYVDDHISYQNKTQHLKINFEDGKALLCAELTDTKLEPVQQPKHRKLNPNNIINFWINARIKPSAGSNKNKAANLQSLYSSYLDFEVITSGHKIDTIVTYDYDANFNQIEKRTFQKSDGYTLSLRLDKDAKNLKDYFKKIGAYNHATDKITYPLLPDFEFYLTGDKYVSQLSTEKDYVFNQEKIPSNDFFFLQIDFLKFNKLPFMQSVSNFKIYKKLEVKGYAVDAKKIKIDAELTFLNEEKNALINLFQNNTGNPLSFNITL